MRFTGFSVESAADFSPSPPSRNRYSSCMRKTLLCLILVCSPLQADDDSFRERFADPATRTAALSELIPGTQSAYFHTALDHQLAGREAEFKKALAEWKAASARKENPVSAEAMTV